MKHVTKFSVNTGHNN